LDWSEDRAVIGGEQTKLQLAQLKLSWSRAFMLGGFIWRLAPPGGALLFHLARTLT